MNVAQGYTEPAVLINRYNQTGRLNSRFQTACCINHAMKQQILDYIRANPGCTVSGVNDAVRDKHSFYDWKQTRKDVYSLVGDGLVEVRGYRGISVLYLKSL